MGNKIKIHEIAKKIGVSSKEVLDKAKTLGIEVASHLSGVEEDEAKKIENSFKSSTNKEQKNGEKTSKIKENKKD